MSRCMRHRWPPPLLGSGPSGPTARRALEQAGAERALERIARARAKARACACELIEATPAGFPWLEVAGKTLTGWTAIDMDATLITAHSDKDGAAPTWKKGYGSRTTVSGRENTHSKPSPTRTATRNQSVD